MEAMIVPDLMQAKEYIYSINFSGIIDKMVNQQRWLKRDAVLVSNMYKNFLFLKKKYLDDHELPPSEEIDIFWHNHILDTEKYRNDCQKIFGKYLNHYPYFGIDGTTNFSDLKRAFQITQKLYMNEFEENIVQVRGIKSQIVSTLKILLA